MLFLFDRENSSYTRAVYEIETMKADICRMKLELLRKQEERRLAESNAANIEANINYLKTWAKVVSIKEYVRATHYLSAELQVILLCNQVIPTLEKAVAKSEAEVARLEANLPSLKTKILEFKRRD